MLRSESVSHVVTSGIDLPIMARPDQRSCQYLPMEIRRLTAGDRALVLAAAELFDAPPTAEWTERFLTAPGHHLLLAEVAGEPAGFVTGVELVHPDKGTEMFLYELGVASRHRRRGIGSALVERLGELARELKCYGMWVAVDPGNEVARRTYRRTDPDSEEASVIFTWTAEP